MKAIKTTYIAATNTKGSRILATDEDKNKVYIPYPSELSDMDCYAKAAIALCLKMGWTGQLRGGGFKSGYFFVFEDKRAIYPIPNKDEKEEVQNV